MALLLLVVPTLLGAPPGAAAADRSGATGASSFLHELDTKVDHVIIVTMENHAYDNLFGVYCLTKTKYCPNLGHGESYSLCVPLNPNNQSAGCVHPFNFTARNYSLHAPLYHFANNTTYDWNNGSMNDFYLGEDSRLTPFGHYNGATDPIYWDLAEEYGLADNYFSSTMSYTLPNRWHLVAGQAPPAIQWQFMSLGSGRKMLANRTAYLDEANRTQSVQDLFFNATHVSWKWYERKLPANYSQAIGSTKTDGPWSNIYNYFNPQEAKAQSYNASFSPHYVNNSQFFVDARAGHLPNVSYVVPYVVDNDHPPSRNDVAQGWVASVVDAVEASPEWNTSLILVTYDEYGGFYDGVDPPVVNGEQLGFRIPLLAIGPYVREGVIDHSLCYLECLLHLLELRWNLPCLTAMDCNAGNAPLAGFFNWTMPPRPPIMFPTSVSQARYPMAEQTLGVESFPAEAPYYPPEQYANAPDLLPDID